MRTKHDISLYIRITRFCSVQAQIEVWQNNPALK